MSGVIDLPLVMLQKAQKAAEAAAASAKLLESEVGHRLTSIEARMASSWRGVARAIHVSLLGLSRAARPADGRLRACRPSPGMMRHAAVSSMAGRPLPPGANSQ